MYIVSKTYHLISILILLCGNLFSQGSEELFKKGEENLFKGRNDLAIDNFYEAYRHLDNIESKDAALYLNELGIAHWNEGNTDQALKYLKEALRIRSTFFVEDKSLMAASYNDIGLVYSSHDNKAALLNYQKALEFYKADSATYSIKIAQLLMNIGIINLQQGKNNEAQLNFDDAKNVFETAYGKNHPKVAFALANIGKVYKARKIYNVALNTFKEALFIYEGNYGQKHPEIAQVHDAIGQCQLLQQKYESALESYQKALIASVSNFNNSDISINPIINDNTPQVVLHTLLLKSQAFDAFYSNHSLKIRDLKRAISCLQSCDTLIDILRHKKDNSKDKILLGTLAEEVYNNGVNIAFNTSEVSWNSRKYQKMAFYFSEKAKSAVLLEAITDSKAKSFANIPDEVIEKEKELKAELNFVEQQLINSNNETRKNLESQLLTLHNDYRQFVHQLETDYPAYFKLKYAIETATIEKLQKNINDNTTIFSYFLSTTSPVLYVFYIDNKNFKIRRVLLNSAIGREIKYFRNAILFNSTTTYLEKAQNLFNTLFPIDKFSKNTIIIPHGGLGLIPFEALITKETKNQDDFSLQKYLLKETSIAYAYSATLFLENLNIRPQTRKKVLAIAPIKFNHLGGKGTRSGLSDLPGTSLEVKEMKNIFGDRLDLDTLSLASESQLKATDLKDYSILHFATHGEVNENQPELSRIYLAQENIDTKEDGNLYAGEIFNLENNADLVVLSACQTGIGKITKGEGIIGLSRALIYSGADNLIVSLWKVADESTAMLMKYFYEGVAQEKGYSEALNDAKKRLLLSNHYSSPYFWAPFILIGK